MRKILVVGAAGGVAGVLVRRLLKAGSELRFTLADVAPEGISADILQERTAAARLNLFDSAALDGAVGGHDLALNCAGPFIRTAERVARACVNRGIPYLDLADDIEAVESLLPLDPAARAAGTPLLIGAGVSPGLTNVFAADLKRRFESVEALDVAWLSGDEGGEAPGRAVLEHVIHIAGDKGARWRDGAMEEFPSYSIPARFPMGGAMGSRTLFEVAHPEPLMLARSFPGIPLIRCFGGIDPPAVGAVVCGVARAVKSNRITLDEAIQFMQGASSGRFAAPRAWLHAVAGLAGGLGDGMIDVSDVLDFAAYAAGRHKTFAGGILCRATGVIDGQRKTLVLRSSKSGPGTFVDSMANGTGTCAAAFALLMLDRAIPPGVRFPERANPGDVYSALARLGFPTDEMIETVEAEN